MFNTGLNPQMPSVMNHDFSKNPDINIKRSAFKAPFDVKTMFDNGKLIPAGLIEIVPGDTIKVRPTALVRLSTPIVPFMDNLRVSIHAFFVPNRLVWDNWRKFLGERINPNDSISYTVPVVTGPVGGHAVESVFDYYGVPIGVQKNVNALPFRGYNLIYREWYRVADIINSPAINTGDGPDTASDYSIRRRAKSYDYFTQALPWPQKNSAVSIALAGSAPVEGIGKANTTWAGSSTTVYQSGQTSGTVTYNDFAQIDSTSNNLFRVRKAGSTSYPDIVANLTGVSAVTINALREAIALQAFAEIEARGGTRYNEIIWSMFGVMNPDMSHRPVYLGGITRPLYVTPVPQTSQTGTTEQGNLAAFASATLEDDDEIVASFTEHGYVHFIISTQQDLTYQKGLHRTFSRATRHDYYFPQLAHLGEQAVLNQEIYLQGNSSDTGVFGYVPRYDEYRYQKSLITGKLNSAHSAPLDMWHLSQKFTALPTLSQAFIEEDAPISRVVAVTTEPQFVADIYYDLTMVRPMPMYSVPGFTGHF